MEVPYQHLNSDTLRSLIEEFVTRDGTDYGEVEVAIDTKVEQVMEQLKNGKSVITFDEETQTCNISNG